MSPPSPTGNAFSKSATVSDFRRLSRQLTPEPSPQAWLASSKRHVGALNTPASPLEMLSPITGPLDASQWKKRISLLTHRYLIEYGIDREEEIVEKAFRTLELFCINNIAKHSLEKFKSAFVQLSTTSLEQRNNNPLGRSSSWISFPSFLDESFNLSHTSLSLEQQPVDTSTFSDITQDTNNRRPQIISPTSIKRSSLCILEETRPQNPESNRTMSRGPRQRYMTPTLASKAQKSTSPPQYRPTTPASAGSATEKRKWMANAGRRLGITTPKSRREGRVSENSSAGTRSPDEDVTVSSKSQQMDDCINKAQVQKGVESLGPDMKCSAFNIHQARLNREYTAPPKVQSGIPDPQPKGSPPEKPLPSLPVATIRSRSPIVRRSLIDASEKPLRQSLSPSPGVEEREMWPAIQPTRPASPNILQSLTVNCSVDSAFLDQQQRQNSPFKGQESLGEEIIDGTPVKARDHSPSDGTPALRGSSLGAAGLPDTVLVNAVEQATEAGRTHAGTCIGDILASAASVEHNAPDQQTRPDKQPRQTRTSLMRARLSSGSNHVPEKESKIDQKATSLHHSSPPRNRSTANVNAIPKRLSVPGPVRSRSHSRRAVSARNSPYGQGNRVSGQVVKSHFNASPLTVSPNRGKPLGGGGIGGLADLTAVKQITASGMSTRRSHIPVRRRSKDSEPEESEADIHIKKSASYVNGNGDHRNFKKSEDADIDIYHKASSIRHEATSKNADIIHVEKMETANEAEVVNPDISCSSPKQHGFGSATKAQAEIQPSTTTLSSIALEEDINLSPNSPNGSDVLSLRDFAATEAPNYHVKRLSLAAPEHGPTLRISEDAEMILMGTYSEEGKMGDNLRTSKSSSMSELQKSAVIKEQFKGRMLKGQLLISRSTTSRSLNKFDTETNLPRAAAPSAGDVGMTRTNDAVAGSEVNDSRLARSIVGEDPFVHNVHLPLAGHVTENSVPKDEHWLLRCAEAPHSDLKSVSERQSEEEDSWISPLATAVAQNNEGAAKPTFKVLDKKLAIYDIQDHQQSSKGAREVQNLMKAAAKNPNTNDGTTSAEGHSRPPFPARISSRTQFRDLIQERSEKDRPVSSRQSTSPEIPNRFASVRSTNPPKAISTPPASVTRSENVRRLDFNASTNGLSSLRQRHAPDSAKAEVSATKGMLSNFRGLFNKRSLENTDAASAMTNNGSVHRKNALFSKSGRPFPNTITPVTSKPLSTGPRSCNARVTPTPSGIGADRATDSMSPAFATPGSGETQRAERLAVHVLDSALVETNAQKRAKLGQLGRFMVHAVTAAKDAEKAVEEARQAAATAEVHSIDAKRCLWHVSEMVEAMLQD